VKLCILTQESSRELTLKSGHKNEEKLKTIKFPYLLERLKKGFNNKNSL